MKVLFRLDAVHPYYTQEGEAGVRFVPTTPTVRSLSRWGIRLDGQASRLQLSFDPEQVAVLHAFARDPVEPLVFTFAMRMTDPVFLHVTRWPGRAGFPLWFEAAHFNPEVVPEAGHRLAASEIRASGSLSAADAMRPFLAVIALALSPERGKKLVDRAMADRPEGFRIRLAVGESHWRYHIPVARGKEDPFLAIVDPEGEIPFFPAGIRRVDRVRDQAVFLSGLPIPFSQDAPPRFQLQCGPPDRCRTLVKALPNAPPDGLATIDIDGRNVPVSDIHVHHYVHGR